jgi:hypothetical protein
VTVGRNRFIAPPNLRMGQCASLIAPYELGVIASPVVTGSPRSSLVKPGDDSEKTRTPTADRMVAAIVPPHLVDRRKTA